MAQEERKEIIQLNGLTILMVMVLIANFLIVGFFYRWHHYQIFLEEKKHNSEMNELKDRKEHDLKNQIVALEGVKVWNDTAYMKNLNIKEVNK